MAPYTGNRDELSTGLDMPMPRTPLAFYQRYKAANRRSASQRYIGLPSMPTTRDFAVPETPSLTQGDPPGTVYVKRYDAQGRASIEVLWSPREERIDIAKLDQGAIARLVAKCK